VSAERISSRSSCERSSRVQHLGHDALQLRVVRQLGEGREAPVERQARGDERRELLGEDEQVLGPDPSPSDRGQRRDRDPRRAARAVGRRPDVERNEAAILESRDGDRGLGRLERSLDDLPFGINRAVLELRHESSPRRTPALPSVQRESGPNSREKRENHIRWRPPVFNVGVTCGVPDRYLDRGIGGRFNPSPPT
jgi:hypothetical protein